MKRLLTSALLVFQHRLGAIVLSREVQQLGKVFMAVAINSVVITRVMRRGQLRESEFLATCRINAVIGDY